MCFFLAAKPSTGQQPALTTQPTVSKPSVPTPSTLKNKTMEEILNKWTTELAQQTKDFHTQASKVAQWDQQLIENGNKVREIMSHVFSSRWFLKILLLDCHFVRRCYKS